MKIIRKLMGRRQFLIAAGVASTCALTCKKLIGFQTRATMAADTAAASSIKGAGNRCPNLLSPLRIRKKVLKNRIYSLVSANLTFQGPENYPTEAYRNQVLNMAKNSAVVPIRFYFGTYPKEYHTKDDFPNDEYLYEAWNSWEHVMLGKWENIPPVWNYIERMIDDIHTEGALVTYPGKVTLRDDKRITPGDSTGQKNEIGLHRAAEVYNRSGIAGGRRGASQTVEEIVADAREAADQGWDVYQMSTPSLEAVEAVRNATDLIIMSSYSPSSGTGTGAASIPGIVNMNKPTASQLEQAVEEVRKLEGLADFVLIRGRIYGNWVSEKDELLAPYYYAEAIKKAGLKIITCMEGGFHDPIKNDEFIARGITDMVGITRPFFAEPEFVKKVAAGRPDDIIPCIQCQDCHAISMLKGPHLAMCDVNPKFGTPAYKLQNITSPLTKKKVAVIGGGPAGMKASLVASERGHKVTLYEKDAALGGLQKYTDYTPWNWTYKVFKDWLINQVNKTGIEVHLNTTATPEMIKSKEYDTVLVAVGAELVESKMKGADAGNVFNILTCYSNKKALGEDVVMIGAGRFGTEAAVSMVKDGHKVTVLAPGDEMVDAEDAGPHSITHQENIYKNHPDFKYFMKTTAKNITGGKVTYTDEKGAEKFIQADSIVIWSGLKPRMEEATSFSGSADEVLLLGDCTGENGRLLKAIRNAFFVASQV